MVWVANILAIVYGAISAFAGVMHFQKRLIPRWSGLGMVISGLIILVSSIFIHSAPNLIFLLTIGLILMHVFPIVNGYHLYGEITSTHHLIRLLLSVIIVIFHVI